MSGYAPETPSVNGMVTNEHLFPAKPFKPTEFLQRIRDILDIRTSETHIHVTTSPIIEWLARLELMNMTIKMFPTALFS